MELRLYQVDAFTRNVFGGNPAAVCPLATWLADSTLQNIALENNLSETAFFVPENGGFHLRWFTPTTEVDLCGHATLASAYVLMNHMDYGGSEILFRTKSGELRVTREGDLYSLDFPARPPKRLGREAEVIAALGVEPDELWIARDYMAVLSTEQQVRAVKPDFARLATLDAFALIVTAPGTRSDFVSRFFAPGRGVDEDPATGSSHCTLVPYWAERLRKNELHALQLSGRGGELFCKHRGERVSISGATALYAVGTVYLDDAH